MGTFGFKFFVFCHAAFVSNSLVDFSILLQQNFINWNAILSFKRLIPLCKLQSHKNLSGRRLQRDYDVNCLKKCDNSINDTCTAGSIFFFYENTMIFRFLLGCMSSFMIGISKMQRRNFRLHAQWLDL